MRSAGLLAWLGGSFLSCPHYSFTLPDISWPLCTPIIPISPVSLLFSSPFLSEALPWGLFQIESCIQPQDRGISLFSKLWALFCILFGTKRLTHTYTDCLLPLTPCSHPKAPRPYPNAASSLKPSWLLLLPPKFFWALMNRRLDIPLSFGISSITCWCSVLHFPQEIVNSWKIWLTLFNF